MSFVIWELTWNDHLPFLRYISQTGLASSQHGCWLRPLWSAKPARACIIATWLLVISLWFGSWRETIISCFKIHQPKQGWHHRNMAVDYGFVISKTSQSLHHGNMAVGYVFCDLELTWNDNLPFLRYIKPARACIIATWLLVMSFVMWELTWNGKLSFCKIHQAIQGWHHCKMAVSCVFFDPGADENRNLPF